MCSNLFRTRILIKSMYNYRLQDLNLKNIFCTRKPRMACIASVRSSYSSKVFMQETRIPITFVQNETTHVAFAEVGDTILDVVLDNQLDFSDYGICGGTCACSTCHVILKEEDFKKLYPPSTLEIDILDLAPEHCETSRLGCQIEITEDMAGLVLRLPTLTSDQRSPEQTETVEEKNP